MKSILTTLLLFLSLSVFGQQISWKDWEVESKTDIRLLPKYGNAEKTPEQKKIDQDFIAMSLAQDTTHRKASDHLIGLGFKYIYRDIKTAMYRFNQAYLLDPTNADI